MKIRAAVLKAFNEPLNVRAVDLAEPGRNEVLIRILASGICRSDLHIQEGAWPLPLPMVLGHEAVGDVVAVGDGVDDARLGERVVVTFSPPCGRCRNCLGGAANLCSEADAAFHAGTLRDGTTRLSEGRTPVHHLVGISSFATHAVVLAGAAIPVPPELPVELLCILGCGATTGIYSVIRRASVRPGESVVVFGCGGVGLSAIAGSRLVSANPIIGIDPVADKRALALHMGADQVIDPSGADILESLRRVLPDGADYAFDAIGRPDVLTLATSVLRPGGTCVLIGQAPIGVDARFGIFETTEASWNILGSNQGSANPVLDVPRLTELIRARKLDLSPLVTHRFELQDINEALELVRRGVPARAVIDLEESE